ncbi:uncharacterized protein TNCV_3423911 [Trichonephila clavipes]|nr:uncharacterized protein TNCV_3423911 [Trichonephila clavipes]
MIQYGHHSSLRLRGALDRRKCRSKGGNQRKTFLPSANNFMVPHPGQIIIDKNIGERLSTAYFREATVGNAVKGFKKCGIETHNPLVFSEHDFTASKATEHDVVGDETENNSANPQTLVVENQHINPPEEPELMANADYDALREPVSAFYFKPLPKETQCETKKKNQKSELKYSYKHTHKRNVRTKGKAEGRTGNLKKQRREAHEA